MAALDMQTAELPDPDTLEPVPPGEYMVEIVASDVVLTKAGDGERLSLTLNIVGGNYENHKIFDNINFRNPNEIAERIGKQTIKAICQAVGFEGHLEDSTALHGVPLLARVVIDDKNPNYKPKNVVKGYRAAQQSAPPPRSAAPAAKPKSAPAARAPAAAPTKAGGMPWKK